MLILVKEFPWDDFTTCIRGPVSCWRACFTRALAANLSQNDFLCAADFPFLHGVKRLDLAQRRAPRGGTANSDLLFKLTSTRGTVTVSDADFQHLRGVQYLDISGFTTIGDDAFACLTGVRVLKMMCCKQDMITDRAFSHLVGIHELNMAGCDQFTITDDAFQHLIGIKWLCIHDCTQFTDDCLVHLTSLQILYALADQR